VASGSTLSLHELIMAKLTNNEMLKGLHDLRDRRSRNELFKQVGRVVVTLSQIENLMAMAFICVSQRMAIEESERPPGRSWDLDPQPIWQQRGSGSPPSGKS
jgi:hypothetical protein